MNMNLLCVIVSLLSMNMIQSSFAIGENSFVVYIYIYIQRNYSHLLQNLIGSYSSIKVKQLHIRDSCSLILTDDANLLNQREGKKGEENSGEGKFTCYITVD